jgi:probable rRNA maturation factor
MTSHQIELQIASDSKDIPRLEQFQYWANIVLKNQQEILELVVRIVDIPEMSTLNETYRHKTGPTNILSFPFENSPELALELNLLGDLVICAPVLEKEAAEQSKQLEHHWAHIFVHGLLHLLGYDHIHDNEAEEMEALEIEILSKLLISNPYQEQLINE